MWGHFLGYGFTKPVDDMGPHNPPSHPELLDRLGQEFVTSQLRPEAIDPLDLLRAYSLTSRVQRTKNKQDDPPAGEMPLFSHLYLQPMQAEQLYDSLIVATDAHKAGTRQSRQGEATGSKWLQQFVAGLRHRRERRSDDLQRHDSRRP